MIPRASKRLAEVDFPIAAVSKHAAREKLRAWSLGEDDVNGKGPGDSGPRGDGGALDPRVLDAIVRRVVEVARPERIILFGSAARGDMTRHSDVDLLVIANVEDRLGAMGRIHRRLRGEHAAVDVVVVTPAEVVRYRNSHASIIKPAMQEGRIVYEAP